MREGNLNILYDDSKIIVHTTYYFDTLIARSACDGRRRTMQCSTGEIERGRE